MISKELLKRIIIEKKKDIKRIKLNPRKYKINLNKEYINVLTGPRRVGKTYFLYFIAKHLNEPYLFINFEDERLKLERKDLDKLLDAYFELYPTARDGCVLFFDEIQKIEYWELFVNRLYEKKKYKIVITGSSSKVLSSELPSTLRGRTVETKIHTLSFKEFLTFKKTDIDINEIYTRPEKYINLFREYLYFGGYPALVNLNKEEKLKLSKTYYYLIIYKDTIEHYKIRLINALKELVWFFSNLVMIKSTLTKTYKLFSEKYKLNKETFFDFVNILKEVGFISFLDRYSKKPKEIIVYPKKIYILDNVFFHLTSLDLNHGKGLLLENTVYQEFRRRESNVFYWQNEKGIECDFVYVDKLNKFQAIQVTYELNDQNKDREVKGLLEAIKYFGLKEGLLLTYDQEDEMKVNGKRIIVKPVWKWLLLG